jgi:hypothetical protein
MTDDPLAKWRKTGARERKAGPRHEAEVEQARAGVPPEAATTEESGYRAFSVLEKGISDFLSIVRVDGLVRRFSYNGLVEIADDGDLGTQIVLVFNFGPVIFIYGKSLSKAVLSLCFRRTEYLQEFNPERWGKPEKGEPVIEKIVIKDRAENETEANRHIKAVK